ncbi:hypothetical protein CA267_001950 [Alteromonas pelagimontana]|uniref:Uncharacterized protein n=1 Tax=Alteromonas pelagimontana TaxID=1858656 RepID=A0A6M4M942_9ALTE|nr:hypothetical protein [Alteromonas pelagimontana]QJR79647.1 hypothetical protein CA267_001950 [Alteromonas pelagimontana]
MTPTLGTEYNVTGYYGSVKWTATAKACPFEPTAVQKLAGITEACTWKVNGHVIDGVEEIQPVMQLTAHSA